MPLFKVRLNVDGELCEELVGAADALKAAKDAASRHPVTVLEVLAQEEQMSLPDDTPVVDESQMRADVIECPNCEGDGYLGEDGDNPCPRCDGTGKITEVVGPATEEVDPDLVPTARDEDGITAVIETATEENAAAPVDLDDIAGEESLARAETERHPDDGASDDDLPF
jgi:hypothetical protein